MPAGTAPIFVTTPKRPSVRIATANPNRDGSTGTYATLFTAGSNGSFFKAVRVIAEGTVTAGIVRIFIQKAGAGNFELYKEVPVIATTPSASVEVFTAEYQPSEGLVLEAGDVIKCSTHNSETLAVSLEGGGDY